MRKPTFFTYLVAITLHFGMAAALPASEPGLQGRPWPRHIIDDSSRGADGVRLADVNQDGLPDIVTGWEEGGVTRVYVHPGPTKSRDRWPAVTVGQTPNVEDAVLVDLDDDGRLEVVTSCEGGTRTIFVHWAPEEPESFLLPKLWKTEPLGASQKRMMWMFCLPLQVDGRHGVDLVAAGKGANGAIGWFEAPVDPNDIAAWKWHSISLAGWVMSLKAMDVDADGDLDILVSDRKGPLRGCRWLENPGHKEISSTTWTNHFIGGRDHEVMFLTVADLEGDRENEILAASRDNGILLFNRSSAGRWHEQKIDMPQNVGTGKGVAVGDMDGNGSLDIVLSCENAGSNRSGVMWLSRLESPFAQAWRAHEISGPVGIKFDRIELVDVDGDGDLDVLACEESHPVGGKRRGLGVLWYENPR